MKPRGITKKGWSLINGPNKTLQLQVTCGKGSYGIVKEPFQYKADNAKLPDSLSNIDNDLSGDYQKLITAEWVRKVFNPSYKKFCDARCISYDIKDFIYGKRKDLTS